MTAHLLSLSRVALALPFAWAMLDPERFGLAAALCAIAIASDFLDGIVARRTGTASARGRLIDHGSDFTFVSAGLLAAASRGAIPWLLPILVTLAFAQYVIDSLVLERRSELRPNLLGRWNGILYFVVLIADIVSRSTPHVSWLAFPLFIFALALVASTLASMLSRALALRRNARSC